MVRHFWPQNKAAHRHICLACAGKAALGKRGIIVARCPSNNPGDELVKFVDLSLQQVHVDWRVIGHLENPLEKPGQKRAVSLFLDLKKKKK